MHAFLDPIHDIIEYSAAEKSIIDSPLVQRLRGVHQLSGASKVFPAATHTRFIHSLGVMHLAGKMFDVIFTKRDIFSFNDYQKWRTTTRMAALLHDIAHGPFSHVFDQAIYRQIYTTTNGDHDNHRIKLITSELLSPLLNEIGVTTHDIIDIWNLKVNTVSRVSDSVFVGNIRYNDLIVILGAIVQGPFGADRLDFVLRDAYYTGMPINLVISLREVYPRIFSSLSIRRIESRWRLHYDHCGLSDLLWFLEKRALMYETVYLCRKSHTVDNLIHQILSNNKDALKLVERTNNVHAFVSLTESAILGEILAANSPCSSKCRDLAQKYMQGSENDQLVEDISASECEIYTIEPAKFGLYHIYILDNGRSSTLLETLNRMGYAIPAPIRIAYH